MTTKEQIKAIIKQYADKGMNNFHKALKDDGKEAVTTKYWDGFSDCANLLLVEMDSMQEEPTTLVWHDASERPAPKYEAMILGKYNDGGIFLDEYRMLYAAFENKRIEKWAYLEDLLKL